MQATATRLAAHDAKKKQCQYYRIERQFSTQRRLKELVCDLLRAHSGT